MHASHVLLLHSVETATIVAIQPCCHQQGVCASFTVKEELDLLAFTSACVGACAHVCRAWMGIVICIQHEGVYVMTTNTCVDAHRKKRSSASSHSILYRRACAWNIIFKFYIVVRVHETFYSSLILSCVCMKRSIQVLYCRVCNAWIVCDTQGMCNMYYHNLSECVICY